MRVHKKVLSRHTDTWLTCCWDDCEKQGFDLYKAVVNYANVGEEPYPVKYVFCSERHKMYWVNGHRSYGNLPSGYRSLTP